jgi:hypothetical protein
MSFAGLPSVPRRIVGFHPDDDGQWVAELECGHGQHVRHDPPWQNRPWTQSESGRAAFLGTTLGCVKCADEGMRTDEDSLKPS